MWPNNKNSVPKHFVRYSFIWCLSFFYAPKFHDIYVIKRVPTRTLFCFGRKNLFDLCLCAFCFFLRRVVRLQWTTNVNFRNGKPSHLTHVSIKNVMVDSHHRAELRFIHVEPATALDNKFRWCIQQFFAARFLFIFLSNLMLIVVIVTDTRQSNRNVFIIIEANLSYMCVCGTSHSMRLFGSLNAVLKEQLKNIFYGSLRTFYLTIISIN